MLIIEIMFVPQIKNLINQWRIYYGKCNQLVRDTSK